VIFNRSALGFLVSGFFGTVLWTTAGTELAAGETDHAFPRRYASIRRCVKDIIDAGGSFYATVEGREVETGRSRIVRGRVADVELGTNEAVATLSVETEDGTVDVGGRVAALETIEAHELTIGREQPP
jgi:hypothetical protein